MIERIARWLPRLAVVIAIGVPIVAVQLAR